MSESDEKLLEPFFEADANEMPKPAPIKLDKPAKPNERAKTEESKKPEEPAADPDAKP